MKFHPALALAATIAASSILLVMASITPGPARAVVVCPPNPDPVDPNNPVVIVDQPEGGQSVTSPLRVEGRAHVFEGELSLALFDASGNTVAEGRTMAGGGELLPYAHELEFAVSETQPGCLRVYQVSAEDGSPITVVDVEVTLVGNDAATPAPPDTGAGTVAAGSDSRTLPVAAVMTVAVVSTLGAGLALLARRARIDGSRGR